MKSAASYSFILAFLSGFVDAAVFVHMGGLFVAHVTGNFVLLGATLAGMGAGTGHGGHGGSAALQLISFPIFFAAVMLAAAIAGRFAEPRRTLALLWIATLLTLGTGLTALAGPGTDPVLAMILVVAMGILNAAQRLDGGLGAPFTVMTGNVTGVAIAAAQGLRLAPAPSIAPKPQATRTLLLLVIGFGVGCALGAVAQAWWGLGAMVAPALLLGVRLLIR
jgi:uncharacterized membrane protein YoaK (UPF0700 family)